MKKFVALIAAAGACMTAVLTPASVYAQDSSKAESKSSDSSQTETKKQSETSKVSIMAMMPQEWLDDGNYDFEMIFSNQFDEKRVFLDEDNDFKAEIELDKYQIYAVTFSDDVDGYDIGGIDMDSFMAENENEMVVLSFRRQRDIAEGAEADGCITRQQADDLEAARQVVQKFVSNTKKIGLDENDASQSLLFHLNKSFIKKMFYEGTGKYYTPEVYKELTETEAFYCYWLSYRAYMFLDPADPYAVDGIDEGLGSFKDYSQNNDEYDGFKTAIGKEVRCVWEWLLEQGRETGSMPDLFTVYMDMKNNVEYEIEDGGLTETAEVTADEDVVHKESRIVVSLDDTEVPESERMDFSDKRPHENTPAENAKENFGGILKDNWVTLVFIAVFGTAFLITKRLGKKSKEQEDDDD